MQLPRIIYHRTLIDTRRLTPTIWVYSRRLYTYDHRLLPPWPWITKRSILVPIAVADDCCALRQIGVTIVHSIPDRVASCQVANFSSCIIVTVIKNIITCAFILHLWEHQAASILATDDTGKLGTHISFSMETHTHATLQRNGTMSTHWTRCRVGMRENYTMKPCCYGL